MRCTRRAGTLAGEHRPGPVGGVGAGAHGPDRRMRLATRPAASLAATASATRGVARRRGCSSRCSRTAAPVGVVFDIDGVLLQGKLVIPGAAEALARLRAAAVPHVFVTNGGGRSEGRKASQLAALLGGGPEVASAAQVCLAHSPMRDLAAAHAGQNVLLLGCIDYQQVAAEYGFDPTRTFTVPELLAAKPDLWPFFDVSREPPSPL